MNDKENLSSFIMLSTCLLRDLAENIENHLGYKEKADR